MRSEDGGAAATAVEAAAAHYARMLFLQRLRTPGDRAALARLFAATWGAPLVEPARISVAVSPALLRVGRAVLPRAEAWEDPGCGWSMQLYMCLEAHVFPKVSRKLHNTLCLARVAFAEHPLRSSAVLPRILLVALLGTPGAHNGCLEAYGSCECSENFQKDGGKT